MAKINIFLFLPNDVITFKIKALQYLFISNNVVLKMKSFKIDASIFIKKQAFF
jgi:hypothetical protein